MALSHLSSRATLMWSGCGCRRVAGGEDQARRAAFAETRLHTNRGKVLDMTRHDRVTSTAFGQFMASSAGRDIRMAVGIAPLLAGLVVGGIGGWMLTAFGLLLVAAGMFDFCLITGLVDNIWSGQEVREHGRREAPRTARMSKGVRQR